MNRSIILSAVAAVVVGVVATGVVAKTTGYGSAKFFEKVDENDDGKLTRAEMTAFAKTKFSEADTDGNGSLSLEEMTAHSKHKMGNRMGKRGAEMIEKRDQNGDGELNFEEMQAGKNRLDRMFSKLDSDGDGAIGMEEMAAMKKHRGIRHKGFEGCADSGDKSE